MENKRKSKIVNKLTTFLFYFAILFFLIAFNFQDNKSGGWVQQFIPNTNGVSINDIIFIDSLNGFITHPYHIIRTTNGGTNWFVQVTDSNAIFSKIRFSDNIGYILSENLYKTTNKGANWFIISLPSAIQYSQDICVLNKDTLFLTAPYFGGALAKSTNGGVNWFPLITGTEIPSKIYMVNDFIGFSVLAFNLYKTTNGGYNFFQLNTDDYKDIYFLDTIRGWKIDPSNYFINKTTDGGGNWISYGFVPQGNFPGIHIQISKLNKFTLLNKDTLWGFGSSWLTYPNNTYAGFIQISTNGGINWGFQIPDTSFNKYVYQLGSFYNKNNGGGFDNSINGVHTNIGGSDTTYHIITGIRNEAQSVLANKFTLEQNYPNPFNPSTIINVQLSIAGTIKLEVYDISGKLIKTLINQKKSSGNYSIKFDGSNFASGVYFYKLEIWDGKGNYAFDAKKMLLIK